MSERENELFEEWWESEGQYNRAGGSDYEKTFAYYAWMAVVNRQGYKLVPKSFIADIHDMALDGKYLRETDQSQEKFSEIHELCKEVMIGAVDE